MDYSWLNKELNIGHRLNDFKGTLFPFQHQGVAFLSLVKRCLLTDKTGLGKTVQCIASYDLLRAKYPDLKIVIVTLKSTQRQWKSEFKIFLPNIKIEIAEGKPSSRHQTYFDFESNKIDGFVVNYTQLLYDLGLDNPTAYFGLKASGPIAKAVNGKQYILVLDEIQKCKNVSSKTSKCAKWLADLAYGVKGLTATPVYNHLIDIYGIFKLIDAGVFKNKTTFEKEFCIKDYGWNPYGSIIGYKNHDKLKERIKNFIFGRDKKEVAKDLPPFVYKDLFVTLPDEHYRLYAAIEEGAILDAEQAETAVAKIAAFVRAQVAANALEHLDDYVGEPSHPKLDEALRVVEEELQGETVLIYSRFEKTISSLEKMFKYATIPFYRITGKESSKERDENLSAWNDHSKRGETAVMGITSAGGAGLNLQSASTLILIDRPWSGGELDQIRGRIHRIGSKHTSLLEINIIAEGTIDYDVILSLRNKGKNVTKVFGEGDLPVTSSDLIQSIRERINAAKY